MSRSTIREFFGVLLYDTWRYERALWGGDDSRKWLELCNRNESLTRAVEGSGIQCNWRWSSELHAPKYIPSWGRRLMKRALARDPIRIEQPVDKIHTHTDPSVSFIIGHRGVERLPLLLLTLASIANQEGVGWECIVVEESFEREIQGNLPAWAKYRHLTTDTPEQPYNRSRTFNAGAALARGQLVVFHDNDMLVPTNYAAELFSRFVAGNQVINLKRFIFYLTQAHTREISQVGRISMKSPDFVLQNLTGGGSLAVETNAYFSIGGFDERFVGWGGEDVEFWGRAQTLKVFNFGYLPIIHLWHAPQPEKNELKNSAGMKRLQNMMEHSPEARAALLNEKN